MFRKFVLILLLATSLSACASTGTWTPIDPSKGSQEKSEMDMEYCAQLGEYRARGSLAVVAVAVRNSHVERCMRNLGYRKVDEIESPAPIVDAEAKK